MVQQHITELLSGGYVAYCLAAFGIGYGIAFGFTYLKKLGEKI